MTTETATLKPATPQPAVPLAIPGGDYTSLVWLDQGIVVTADQNDGSGDTMLQLVLIDPSQSTTMTLPLRGQQECVGRMGFQRPMRLPNGQLGYVLRCASLALNEANTYYLMAYDFQTGQESPLRDEILPWRGLGPGSYAFNPDMSQGIATEGGILTGQAYWFTRSDSTPIDLGMGHVRVVAWSPDGSQIALIGTENRELKGPSRMNARFNLYLMDARAENMRSVVGDFGDPMGLEWSPNGQWIAFNARFGANPQEGIWAYNAVTDELQLVARGHFHTPSWSPDGRQIAAVEYTGNYPISPDMNVVTIDVSSLMEP